MRRALIIRQESECQALARLLRLRGVEPCIHPLFIPHFFPLPPLENPQGLIITSKNALRALDGRDDLKNLPLYVVGDQTARFAKDQGFSEVWSASGTSRELVSLIRQKASRTNGILWHLSGDIVAGKIVETLQMEGFQAKRQKVYCIEGVKTLPPSVQFELQNQKISHVLFFSLHTALFFVDLLKKNGLGKATHQMTSLCLSHNMVKEIGILEWKKIWVSPSPTLEDMVEYFDEEQ